MSIVDYGAFIALEEGVEGLVHVSEMSWTKKIKNPRSVLEIGQEVDVVVSEVDSEKRRLSLSLRAVEANPWETVAETYHVGNRIQGVVRNLTDFGAFVEIVPGVDGLVHISDMSWTRRINHPSEVVQKGQEVNAVVTAIDVVNQRISLSMKELMPNEWEEYANSHGVGEVASGSVTNITDFGVFIELAPGVEGLCHISEIDRVGDDPLETEFTTGQKVRCRILRVDWNESRIGLSMQGVSQDEAEIEAEAEAAAPADTAMAAALRAGGIVAEDETEAEAEAEPVEAAPEEAEEADPVEATSEEAEAEPVEAAPEEAADEAESGAEEEKAETAAEEVAEEAVETAADETDEEATAEAEEAAEEPAETEADAVEAQDEASEKDDKSSE